MFTFKSFTSNICVYGQYRAYVAVRRMSNSTVNVKIRAGLSTSDPEQTPVLIVGQVPHLNSLTWQDVRCKLEPRVTEALWQRGLGLVSTPSGDSCELWPRGASLASLPARRSRHSPPARPHALAKIVRNAPPSRQTLEYIVLVCRKQDVLASVVSIARSFPLFNARSNGGPLVANSEVAPKSRTVTVEVLLVEDKSNGDGWEPEPAIDPVLLETTLDPEELSTLQDAADYVRLAARITDTPANIMNVDKFIEEATSLAKSLDIEAPTVIRGEALLARGMGGIYGVGRAAACPPALVALSYCPPDASEGVAWVGKGIVYDTGGLSIKTRTAMVGMKGDCAGAAGVLAAFALATRARPRCRLHAVLCLAENAVGPHATRPDDIHTLYSGRTVEINNTDAEGRLVLSDGVVYASRDLKADTIIDVATLTGAQGTATGKYHAAVISNTSWLEAACVTAGLASGDAAHALPFAPELHYCEFSSAVADMKNSVQDRGNAPVSCAGLFMLAQLGFDFRGAWLHVDMASPSSCGERATGYGVALLPVLLGAHTQNRLLRALAPAPIVRPR